MLILLDSVAPLLHLRRDPLRREDLTRLRLRSVSMNQAREVFASRLHWVLIPPVGLYRMAQLFGWLASNSTPPTLGFTHSRMYLGWVEATESRVTSGIRLTSEEDFP